MDHALSLRTQLAGGGADVEPALSSQLLHEDAEGNKHGAAVGTAVAVNKDS